MKLRLSIRYLLMFAGICLFSPALMGQGITSGATVQGKVLDANTGGGAVFVAVRLKSPDGTVIKTAITDTNGAFVLNGVTPRQYQLSFSAVNYLPRIINWNYTDSTRKEIALDTIVLQPQQVKLKEVAITADKPIIKQKAGKIIYDMQADPESRSSNVLNMLRKVPYMSLDGNNNILLKGNSDFRVLINGKSSGMFERDLKNILSSMPASTIQSIEVYTIPPARFDAEGAGGIINIITTRKAKNELKGNLNVSHRWPVGGPGIGSSITFQKNKVGLSAFAGGSLSRTPLTENINERNTFGKTPTGLRQENSDRSKGRNGYFGMELSYEVDTLNLVTGRLNFSGNHGENNTWLNSRLNGTSGLLQQYRLEGNGRNEGSGMDAAVDYQRSGKKDKNRLLTLSYRYSASKSKPENDVYISEATGFPDYDYQQRNDQRTTENTVQLDYVYPGRRLTVEAGLKGIFRVNNSDFKYFSRNDDSKPFELRSDFSDQFDYRQTVLAAYNSYMYNLETWSFQGGVRVEKTLIDADFVGNTRQVKQDYINVFPNLAINKTFKNQHSLNIGYTQRMKRPGINRLNPFVDRQNPDFLFTGNPELRPVVVHSISAGYNIPGKINFTGGADYTFLRKVDLPVYSYDSTTRVVTNSFANTGKIDGLSAFVYASYNVTKQLSLTANGNVVYFWIEGLADGEIIKNELFTYALNLSASYSFEKGWRARADGSIISSNPTGFQGTSNGMVTSTFGISKEVIQGKLSFDANVSNPFTKYRNNRTYTSGPDFYQTTNARNYFRTFNVSMNYNFGGLKGNLRKNKRTIRNNDLSNGKGM